MDKKTVLILTLAKYGVYIAVLWVTVGSQPLDLKGPLLPLLLVFMVDNVRSFFLERRARHLFKPSLFLQLIFIYLFILLDSSTIGSVLLVVLIAESQIACPRPVGDYIFFLSIGGYFGLGLAGFYWRNALTINNLALIFINSLFLFFGYGISYLARRQIEEKERAENTLKELERSQRELDEAYQKLLKNSKEREQLAVIEERNRLAREIHDTLAHTLTTVIISLEAGKKLMSRDTDRALAEFEKSQEQARRGLHEVRRSVRELRPHELETLGFDAALKGLSRELHGSGVKIDYFLEEGAAVPKGLELPFYRVIQESITNSLRHSGAGRITVTIKRKRNALILEIEDDGKGCQEIIEGYGFKGIRERVAEAGGRVEFVNQSPHGFLVKVEVEGDAYDQH